MKKKKIFRCCTLFMCFFVLLAVSQVFGQQADTRTAEEQGKQEKVFKIEEAIIESLAEIIPEEKFKELEKLKDKEFSETELSAALKSSLFTDEETETVLNYAREHLKFVEAVKKAAPVAILMHKTKQDIQKKEQELEIIREKKQKKEISDELGKLQKNLKRHEHNFSKITSVIDGTKTELASDILKGSGYKSEETEIISDYLLKEAMFVKKIDTLSEMVKSIDAIREEIQQYENKMKTARSDKEKKNFSQYINELNDRMGKAKNDFSIITTGIDSITFLKKEGKDVNWEKELKEIFSPIIVELKETTERPRKMERLRSEVLYYDKRLPQIKNASEEIDKLLENVTDKKVIKWLSFWKKHWNQLENEFTTQRETAEHQLTEEERERKSVLASFKIFFDSFVRHRGKNLFYAVLAFFAIYLLFRLLQRIIWKFSPIHRSPKYMFWANLMDVMFYMLTFLVATVALLAVLYTSGDWLILAIVILIVLGIIWGARNTLPQFVEQIKLLLGFGPVRQGELVIIDGISWKVEMMGVYSYLKNPLLTGGTLRLPLKDLIGMRSRPYDEEEPWFPCKEGDFVLINNSDWRKILLQTPQIIKFDWYDMHETMLTSSFLSQKIFNLSETPFWIGAMFYISYAHRHDAMEIGKILEKTLDEEFRKSHGELYLAPWAEFCSFTEEASLGFMAWAQFKKEAAVKYARMKLDLTQICLKAANKYGWDIVRFTHVSLTQPDGVKASLKGSVPESRE